MTKAQFLDALQRRLAYLPESETAKPIAFYAESIDDRVEDGMTEEEAVAALGSVEDIAREIEAALPLAVIVKQRVKTEQTRAEKRGHGCLWIALAIMGFPIWLPLLIMAFVAVVVVYAVAWALIVSLFAGLAGLIVSAIALLVYGVVKVGSIGIFGALMAIGGALAVFGAAILLEEPLKALAKLLARLAGRFWRRLKRRFLGRGGEQI